MFLFHAKPKTAASNFKFLVFFSEFYTIIHELYYKSSAIFLIITISDKYYFILLD